MDSVSSFPVMRGKTHYAPMTSGDDSGGGDILSVYVDRFAISVDRDWTVRQTRLHILKKFLDGSIYNNLKPWYQEYQGGKSGQYVPLQQRRPSVIYMLPKIIVNDSVAMLFGEEHFPVVRCEEREDINDFLQYVTRNCNLRYAMLSAAKKGSIGSVCIVIKVLEGKFYFDVMDTAHLEPIFDPLSPGLLVRLVETRKVLGEVLVNQGYEIKEDDRTKLFFVIREWNKNAEIYYKPILCDCAKKDLKKNDFVPDKDRSTVHDLGFVPAIWMKNSPDCHHIDGEATFSSILDTCIELDYQLSQLGRLLKYNSDPTLVIKDPSQLDGEQLIKGSGALKLGRDGEAYLLEMKGSATSSVIEYARTLREFALEAVRGNRTSPDKITAVHSGQALKMLNNALISFVDELRLCYGDNGLLPIYKMILKICESGKFQIDSGKITLEKVDDNALTDLTLDWPDWFSPTPQDNLQESQTLSTLVSSNVLSQEKAIESIADKYNILDIKKELTTVQTRDKLENETGKTSVDREDS